MPLAKGSALTITCNPLPDTLRSVYDPRRLMRSSASEAMSRPVITMVARARSLGVETPILDLARTHVAAYEISRTRAPRDG